MLALERFENVGQRYLSSHYFAHDPPVVTIPVPPVTAPAYLIESLQRSLQQAIASRQRRALVLTGEPEWAREAAARALQALGLEDVLWLTDRPPADGRCLTPGEARKVLGQEYGALVVDAFVGLDPEALAATAGTIRGGGLLVFLTPPLEDWAAFPDPQRQRIGVALYPLEAVTGHYLARLARILREDRGGVVILSQEPPEEAPVAGGTTDPRHPPAGFPASADAEEDGCRTPDQRRAVAGLLRVASGHRRRPLVLVSDRGRGKSAALGIAAARLLTQGRRLVITAPALETATTALAHAASLLPQAEVGRGHLRLGTGLLEFVPPDALCLTPRPADLVLVDEAATLPVPLLERLLRRYARIAFATTVGGYEGSGRGFAVRFYQTLDQLTPGWRELRLEQPIRWALGDPVERLLSRALLLDAAPAPDRAVAAARPQECSYRAAERDALARDETRLGELFGLLVLAHYRTSPLDLRHLLDGPNLSVHLLTWNGRVVATALVADEGGMDAVTAHQLYLGRRRLRGHLLPQTLCQHQGLEQAPLLRGRRIMRIAVHPAVQRRGLGRRLLREIEGHSRGWDYLGASFGAERALIAFWQGSGFRPARLGVSRNAASGTHSLVMLSPLSQAGQTLCADAERRFHRYLPHLLAEPLRDLDPLLAVQLLRRTDPPRPDLDPQDWRDLTAFAFALRPYEVCMGQIWVYVCHALAEPVSALLPEAARSALVVKVLQRHGWQDTAVRLGLPGREAVVTLLREALGVLLRQVGNGLEQEQIQPNASKQRPVADTSPVLARPAAGERRGG
jgi:tRNA(Met) cytidine acetyltransferase